MVRDKKRILHVEDDELYARLIWVALPEYEVITARTIGEGWQWLNRRRFDLILLDYHLPDGTGTDLFWQILAAWPNLPVIFVSSIHPDYRQDFQLDQLFSAGVKAWLQKPIDFELLAEWVRVLLAPRQARQSGDANFLSASDGL